MPSPLPALFQRHPRLAGRLPHYPLLSGPTPVQTLTLPGLPDAVLFVKRDERSSPLYGGNKPRKLEFVIGDALLRRARRLLTTGALGTHHGLATTLLARQAGLDTSVVLVDQPLTPEVEESLLLLAAHGAEVRYGGNLPGAARECAAAWLRAKLRRERICWVPTGGSGPLGNLGMVSAGCELADQVRAGLLPEPAHLYVAVGTGGSLAGLVLGLRLAGLATRVIGVLVTDILPPSSSRIAQMARRSLARLRAADSGVPDLPLGPKEFPLVTDQLGPGYGASTPAAREALGLAREAGLELEITYTAKCLAEVLARGRSRALGAGPVLFWNTFNAVDVTTGVDLEAARARLPEALQRKLASQREAAAWPA